MRILVIALIFVAVTLAGGTAFLVRSYLHTQQTEIAQQAPKIQSAKILVASSALPVGTVVTSHNTEYRDWPEDGVADGYLVKSQGEDPLAKIEKDKHIVRHALAKGEPITMDKLYASGAPGFLPGVIAPGKRAIAIKVSAESSASGFILPDDRVDVVLTHNLARKVLAENKKKLNINKLIVVENTTETILKNIRVLALDQKVSDFKDGAMLAKTVLLEVTPRQAQILATAKAMGKLDLTLRSAEPRSGAKTAALGIKRPPYTTDVQVSPFLSQIGKELSAGLPKARSVPTARRKSAPAPSPTITIYRGTSSATGATAK
ncbi:Flp pilus assembly protein CpaB [Varunaivibrio sulfuroxidans]|uniref:Pilus assembly protein CpaB n=1 Tax=Varunaivibrio sulfuroxidans TaxID=1773489 RepID=A0A4R3JDV7_9PROT|nr:Flp pilus assembly protein CpaB [Varunaivibrio sulfuroxidans]TCS64032.1 pilus assembly protein CpaB [Varunaivibrio sulfuroxidans]WES31515.1 Flp pilus assembly protein CpaB [Varunaivibrio sulfuroxidans]